MVSGETKLSFTHGQHVLQFEGLVVENLDEEVLAGTPFMKANDIAIPPAKRLIALADGSSFTYGSSDDRSSQKAPRRAVVLRSPATSTTLWAGDYIELELPQDLPPDSLHALEPSLRHSSGTPSNHFRAVAPTWNYFERGRKNKNPKLVMPTHSA